MKLFYILISLSLLMPACEKETSDNIDNDNYRYIVAGAIGESDTLIKLDPPISLSVHCNSDPSFKGMTAQDSLDIFQDGIYDIKFVYHVGEYVEGNGSFCPVSYYVTPLSDVHIGYPKALSYDGFGIPNLLNDTIDRIMAWSTEEIQRLYMGPPGEGREWYENSPCYLGFRFLRKTDTTFGWIKMENLNTIKEYGRNK